MAYPPIPAIGVHNNPSSIHGPSRSAPRTRTASPPVKQRQPANPNAVANAATSKYLGGFLKIITGTIKTAVKNTGNIATRANAPLSLGAGKRPGYVNVRQPTNAQISNATPPGRPRATPVSTAPTAPSGVHAQSFAAATLKGLGAPVTPANIQSLLGWMQRENTAAANNPLATTQPAPGATDLPGNSAGVKNYPSFQHGVNATVATLQNGYYPNIVSQLKSGKGLNANASADLFTWSGQGYTSAISTPSGAYAYGGGSSNNPSPAASPGPAVGSAGTAAAAAAAAASPTAGYGGTRPGGQPVTPPPTPGAGVTSLFADYERELTLPRVAPSDMGISGVAGPFKWWLNSYTGQWSGG